MTIAAIDIGSNTVLLLVVDAEGAAIVDECRFGRLGSGLDASGMLAASSIAATLEICRDYQRIIEQHRAEVTVAVATQAVREAANASAFLAPAERILGTRIEVIAGVREAALAFLSVARTLRDRVAPYLVVDVGGASTELVTTDGARVLSAVSIPIGAVRLTERHLRAEPATTEEVRALRADIHEHLARCALPRGIDVVGTAGTAATIGAVALGMDSPADAEVTGLRLEPSVVETQLVRLLAATTEERRAVPGIHPERAELIAGGVAIYACLLEHVQAPAFIVCDRGVRWGLAFELLDRYRTRPMA